MTPSPLSVAVQRSDAADVARRLAGGADPNDEEALYHATGLEDLTCARLILEARPRRDRVSFCLPRMLDFDRPDGLQIFLEHGADPNRPSGLPDQDAALHHAIRRGRSAAIARMLLSAGADPLLRNIHGHTSVQMALRLGRVDVTRLFVELGISQESVTDVDMLLGACSLGHRAGAISGDPDFILRLTPEDASLLPLKVSEGALEAVRLMLDLGFPLDAVTHHRMTALHWAAWEGHLEMMDLLIARGAPLEARNFHGGTPLGTAIHAARSESRPLGFAAQVLPRLVAAGAVVEDSDQLNQLLGR